MTTPTPHTCMHRLPPLAHAPRLAGAAGTEAGCVAVGVVVLSVCLCVVGPDSALTTPQTSLRTAGRRGPGSSSRRGHAPGQQQRDEEEDDEEGMMMMMGAGVSHKRVTFLVSSSSGCSSSSGQGTGAAVAEGDGGGGMEVKVSQRVHHHHQQ